VNGLAVAARQKGGATGAILSGVWGGWNLRYSSRQYLVQSWRAQSGAMRDHPQPYFSWAMVAWDWMAGTKAMAVIGL